ncbi:hypothetical protein IPL68_07360 [Candidatus Saccharibacteria bacterium]|nr:MAG: hypothetical protein IPL68_07360 [Candidatus Saccharibacteria bacterium]
MASLTDRLWVVIGLYYYNHLLTNIASLALVIVASFVLNKSIVSVIGNKVLRAGRGRRKKSFEEDVFEEVL